MAAAAALKGGQALALVVPCAAGDRWMEEHVRAHLCALSPQRDGWCPAIAQQAASSASCLPTRLLVCPHACILWLM